MNGMRCHRQRSVAVPLGAHGKLRSTDENVTGNRRQVVRLIAQLTRIGERPDVYQGFHHISNGRVLRHYQEPRTGFACGEVCAEVIEHRAAVMRDHDAVFQRNTLQQFGIAHAIKTGFLGGDEIESTAVAAARPSRFQT